MNRACSRSRLRNPLPFTPMNLFSTGEQGVWYDPSDMTTLFQNSTGTTPVTAADQPVGLMRDKSGRGNHASQATAAARPILRNSGALWWLEFDGVDDVMSTGSIDFSVTDKVSLFSGLRKMSNAVSCVVCELSLNLGVNPGTFNLTTSNTGAPNISFTGKGTILSTALIPSLTAPVSAVISADADIAADTVRARANRGTYISTLTDLGAGNFGNYPMFIGRRGDGSIPFVGNLYGLIIRATLTDSLGIANTENYLAAKTGVTLP